MPKGPIHLPVTSLDHSPERRRARRSWPLVALGLLTTAAVLTTWPTGVGQLSAKIDALTFSSSEVGEKGLCEQAEPVLPHGYNTTKVWEEKEAIIRRLQEAIRIPTQMYDEMGPVDEDPRWKIFAEFHAFLEKTFPKVYERANVTKTDWALVYEIEGTDASLKPLMLTAHQDVVPVLPDTQNQWTHDPFGGEYDGTVIHGRGASDTKSSLIAVMSALEHLFTTTDFKPRRPIILAFGSDEERGGQIGAPAIAKYLLGKYGKNSMSLLIDEGSGLIEQWGQNFATPAVAEKGHVDVALTVSTLGGHSSVPPPHTAIGLISLLIAQLEAHPHKPTISSESPIYEFMTCAAAYAEDIPAKLKKLIIKAEKGSKSAWKDLPEEIIRYSGGPETGAGQGNAMRALLTTTQATDIINGGLKVNALPESVKAIINHRVNALSNHLELQDRVVETLLPVAKTYNLTLVDFDGKTIFNGSPSSKVNLDVAYGYYTDPAPHSPTDLSDPAWNVLAGTTRGVWASRKEVSEDGTIVELGAGKDLVLAPYMSTGNTDTRRYLDLTPNIYRYRYFPMKGAAGAHTINEYANADDLIEFTRFYQAIILNMDQTKDVA
ncbi:Gly-Xaa carboxypeptidase [Kwoniella heveanensis CBS 569]|nr:Gly-Xaa carboxypeptidase [Kwoniella heveanensis CBS 569]